MDSIRRMALCAVALAGLAPVAGCGHAATQTDAGVQGDAFVPMEDAHVVTCDPSQTLCGSTCVDTLSDAQHCGNCDTACNPGASCIGGSCVLMCSGATPNMCGTTCVDFTTDAQHCGSCTNACASGESCVGGSCTVVCGTATPDVCGTTCVDLSMDPQHCGSCTNACTGGDVCSSGACAPNCTGGTMLCGGACADITDDAANCGSCGHTCTTEESCVASSCVAHRSPTSCYEIHLFDPTAPSGSYRIDPDGLGAGEGPYDVYCDMTSDGGGWTLALKVDGAQPTFLYDAPIWVDTNTLHPDSTDTSATEAKFASFWNVPISALRITADSGGGAVHSLVAEVNATSLRGAVLGAPPPVTTIGRAGWLALFPGATIQPNCNQEGISVTPVAVRQRVRIGILGNNEPDCGTSDSAAGIGLSPGGGSCYSTLSNFSAGVIGGGACMNGAADHSAFVQVFVRRLPTSCAEIHGWSATAADGTYTIDPDGAGGVVPFPAYCDMAHGGWTLIMASAALGPTQQTQRPSVMPGAGGYLPLATVQALARIGTQVHVRTAGMFDSRSITSPANALAIANLRNGVALNSGQALTSSGQDPAAFWTGPLAADSTHLWHTCGLPPYSTTPSFYPTLYWACNNGMGFHLTGTGSTFDLTRPNEALEVYVR